MQAGQGLGCRGRTSQTIWIGDSYSEGYCDCSAVPLGTEWYRRTPITVRKSSEEMLQLALLTTEHEQRPTVFARGGRLSGLQTSKGESEPPPP